MGEMRNDDSSSPEDIVEFLQEQRARTGLSMDDFVPIVFDGLAKWTSSLRREAENLDLSF